MEADKESAPSKENEENHQLSPQEDYPPPEDSEEEGASPRNPGFFSGAQHVIDRASEISGIVAVIVLVFMMMLTVSDVFLRYFFSRPIMASAELTEYMMVIVSFLGIAWCATRGTHIKVELLVGRWSDRSQGIIDVINAVIVLGLAGLIANESFEEGLVAREMGRASEITDIPHFPFYWVIVFGYVLLFLVMIGILVRSIRKVVNS
jgi:TRAP-type C4-dicarboxylate transport system permease small subunit